MGNILLITIDAVRADDTQMNQVLVRDTSVADNSTSVSEFIARKQPTEAAEEKRKKLRDI